MTAGLGRLRTGPRARSRPAVGSEEPVCSLEECVLVSSAHGHTQDFWQGWACVQCGAAFPCLLLDPEVPGQAVRWVVGREGK